MILTYDAVDRAGKRESDTLEVNTRQEALELLRGRGLFVTSIVEGDKASTPKPKTVSPARGSELSLNALALVTRQMAMLLRAGSTLVPAFSAISRQMKNPRHAALCNALVADLQAGTPLTDALRKFPRTFDPVYCAIIAAGEASGALADMFQRLTSIVGARRALQRKMLGALAYPSLLVTMCVHILLVLMIFVLPRFADMFVQLGVETPASTQLLLSVGKGVREYWYLLVLFVASVVAGVVSTVTSARGRQWISDIQIIVPIIGPLRSRLIQAQVFRTMGTLLESRVGVLDTLALVRQSTQNRRYQRLFDDLEDTVTRGGHLSQAFEASGVVDPSICQAIRTGEESGSLGGSMTYCADVMDESNAELIDVVMRLVEPAILIVMGFVVGGVAISLFLPLFDLTSAIQ